MIVENAHMQKRTARKSARGGRALLTGLVRCGRCGRMMRVFYGTRSGHAHRYQCRGDDSHVGAGLCIGIGGVRVDQAVATKMVEAVSEHAIEAAIRAMKRGHADNEVRQALPRKPRKRVTKPHWLPVATRSSIRASGWSRVNSKRGGTRRWSASLISRIASLGMIRHFLRPEVDRAALMALAHDLPTTWNAPGTTPERSSGSPRS